LGEQQDLVIDSMEIMNNEMFCDREPSPDTVRQPRTVPSCLVVWKESE